MLAIDHVIIHVADLDEAAVGLARSHGLDSAVGGRHAGLGTANRIVPIGDAYLELLAVVDHDEFARSGLRLPSVRTRRNAFAGWMLRTADIAGVASRLGLEGTTMSRPDADGRVLRWRLAGLERMADAPELPVFIDWSPDRPGHPSRLPVTHAETVTGIAWVEVAGDADLVRRWCGDQDLDVRTVDGEPGVRAVGIETPGGQFEIRY